MDRRDRLQFMLPKPSYLSLCVVALLFLTACTVTPAQGQWRDLMNELGLGQKSGISDEEISAGLKEALRVGTANTIKLTGKTNGFFRNKDIKILMPERLQTLEKGLRLVGYGAQVDEFVLSMNRAAEKAAPQAKDIFMDAIKGMSFDDARQILGGGDTAATDFFRRKTSNRLQQAFRPAVEKTMNQFQVTRQYRDLVGRYENIPFANRVTFDVDQYVVSQATDGLFFVLAQEEKKIRTEPAARATALLKKVFGQN